MLATGSCFYKDYISILYVLCYINSKTMMLSHSIVIYVVSNNERMFGTTVPPIVVVSLGAVVKVVAGPMVEVRWHIM